MALPCIALGQPLALRSGPATIHVATTAVNGKHEIPYAPVAFTLTVDGSAPLKVKLPKQWTASDAWHIFPKEAATQTALDQGRTRWQQTFFLEPLLSGAQDLQLEPLQVQEASGPWQILEWKPLKLNVRAPLPEADVGQLRDITPIEELPPAESWDEAWLWLAGAGLGLIVLALAVWAWRRRRRHVQGLSPEQWALQEIDRLLALELPGRGEGRRFHALLSNVLRRYLERRFFIPARRQTTPEFLRVASQDGMFTAEQQQFFREVLERFDLAKFAGAEPGADECRALAERTRTFIAQTSVTASGMSGNPAAAASQ